MEEMAYAPYFDKIIINDDLGKAVEETRLAIRDFLGE